MKLPQHPALPLLSIAILAYLCGDVACAVMERQFSNRPQRQQAATSGSVVPLNSIKSRGELTALLESHKPIVNDPGPSLGNTTVQGGPGQPGPIPPPTGANATALPQLAGTLEGQGQALAVLQIGQETQVVGVGEEWMGFKVIEVGAFQARLRDPRNQEHTISMALANLGSTPAPPPLTPAGNPFAITPTNGMMAAMDQPYKTSRQLRDDLENKGSWVRNILVQPEMRGGETVGVKINYTNTANPFHRLGIQTGDVVLSLNSKPARGVEDVTNLIMELRNATTLNFQVERSGQQMPITVTLEP
ncbi:PDZ domain-containing protein [bacterium]|nr:PDZ domain-containing protein [bacterium]